MSSEKESKSKSKFNFIIIYIIGFIISIFFEFYWISYFPYDYFMLFGIGIILCIFGYLSIDGILNIINQTTKKRDEQNEIMIKASKAIYLTTKKIALNNSHSPQDKPDSHKDITSLIDDLTRANDRLAKEVENAVSIQSLVRENTSIVNNVRDIMEDSHVQPLSPLEVEKDLKLDESINETDFETITQPETINSMINQEFSVTDEKMPEPAEKISAEPEETVIEIPPEPEETVIEIPPEPEDAVIEIPPEPEDAVIEIPPEPEDNIVEIPVESEELSDLPVEPEKVAAVPEPEIDYEQIPENIPAAADNPDKPLTPEEIASLFANL